MRKYFLILLFLLLFPSLGFSQASVGGIILQKYSSSGTVIPVCNSSNDGEFALVSDQTGSSCINNVAYVSGGNQICPVICINTVGWSIIGGTKGGGGGGTLRTVYVNNTASCPGTGSSTAQYCTIQNAFTNALAGDDIRIQKTGTNYNETDTLSVTGTQAHPITVESDNPSNQPILTDTVTTTDGSVQMLLNAVSYITVQNLKWDGLGQNVAMVALEAVEGGASQVGINVLNNTFNAWAAANSTVDYTGDNNEAVWFHVGVAASHTIGGLIQGNTFTGNRYGAIMLWTPLNVSILNNTITGTVCGISNGAAGHANAELGREDIKINGNQHSNSGLLVQGNTIANDPASCSLSGTGPFSYAEWSGIHVDGGDSNGLYTQNTIHDLTGISTVITTISGIHLEFGTQGNVVSNNLVYNITQPGNPNGRCIYVGPSVAGTAQYVIGNTIYGCDYQGFLWVLPGGGGASVVFEDNISLGNFIAEATGANATGLTSDYNSLFDPSGNNRIGFFNNAIVNFATWKTDTGGDAHSLNSDPTLASPSTGNFLQQAGSNTRGAGTALSQLTVDYAGVTRPNPPSIGAYEYPN